MATKYVTKTELEHALQKLHDDLKENHFKAVLDAIHHLSKGQERLMALTKSEQDQLDRIDTAIDTIAEETKGAAQKILDLMAQHGVDQATIDGMSDEVTVALSGAADKAEALAADLASPTTPLTPTP